MLSLGQKQPISTNKKLKDSGVIVIGGHVQGLGITRIYGKLGLPVIVIDSTRYNIARHSQYCKSFLYYKNKHLLDYLFGLGKSGRFKNYVILPTHDEHVAVLSKNKDKLSQYFIVGTDDWINVEKCYNKRLTYTIADQLKIPIPNTWFPDNLQEIDSYDIKYPCIIKPAVMHEFYTKFKQKVFVCNNKSELIKYYKKAVYSISANEIILQEIIQGGSENLYSACFLFDGDKAINSFVGRRARQHPPDFGNATTFAQIVDNDELITSSVKFLEHIGYKGICEVEYKYDLRDDKYKLLEINPRTWKWHSISEKANVPLLENYLNLLYGEPIRQLSGITKASFRHLITDLPMCLIYLIKRIYKSYHKYPIQYAVWDKDDPKPFFLELIYLLRNIFFR